jgi:transcription termination/antitermination protein NusG
MHVINNIQGVIKFVGAGMEPQPLRDDEINKILGLAPVEEQAERVRRSRSGSGQVVEVMEGPFTDFTGTVQEVYHDKGKVKVEVSLFGRPTSVELDYTQLKGY